MSRQELVFGQRNAVREMESCDLTTRSIQVRAETIDEASRSIEAVISTENPVEVVDWNRMVVIQEVLRSDGVDLPTQVVLLEAHNRWSLDTVLGSIRNLRIEGNDVVGRLYFAESDTQAERAWQKVRQGHVTDVSAGYRVLEYVDIQPNTTATVKGRSYTAGNRTLRVSTNWKLREGSLVPIGADEAAKIRAAQNKKNTRRVQPGVSGSGERVMDKEIQTMNFEQWLQARGIDPDTLPEQRRAELKAEFEGEQRAAAAATLTNANPEPATAGQRAAGPVVPPTRAEQGGSPGGGTPDPDAIRAEAERNERARVRRLREMAGRDISPDTLNRAIDEGWDEGRAAREFLNEMRGGRSAPVGGDSPAIHVRDHERDCNAEVLSAGMLLRAGLPVIDRQASDAVRRRQEQLAEQGHRYHNMSMIDLCRESIRLCGGQVPVTREETAQRAILMSRAMSTGSLSNIFTTVVNAELMRTYTEAPDTTDFVRVNTNIPDFKSNERTRLSKGGNLTKHARGGTADHTTRSDSKEEYKLARYSGQFVVDEMDIIDDRFDALLTQPQEMGMAAARLRPDLVYAILLANASLGADSTALFDSSTHANLAVAALDATSLQAGIVAMAKQTQDGVNLNIAPAFLVVPQDLIFTAQILLRSAERIIAADSGGTYNPLRDLSIQLRADNRIGVAGVTDPASGTAYTGLATNWFLFANPATHPAIEVGYLAGSGGRPTLRQFVLDQGQWGVGWDIKLDIGAKALDYRPAYKSTGAGS